MAGIVITMDGNSVIIETNDYQSVLGTSHVSFHSRDVGILYFNKTDEYINMTIHGWRDASVDVTGNPLTRRLKIDSVLGVECNDLQTLFNQLNKLRNF